MCVGTFGRWMPFSALSFQISHPSSVNIQCACLFYCQCAMWHDDFMV